MNDVCSTGFDVMMIVEKFAGHKAFARTVSTVPFEKISSDLILGDDRLGTGASGSVREGDKVSRPRVGESR